jgi:hypothetical protein
MSHANGAIDLAPFCVSQIGTSYWEQKRSLWWTGNAHCHWFAFSSAKIAMNIWQQ